MTDFAAATADAAGSASRLDSLLAGLAAKTRVHELAKRVGISSRLLMATLAEQGVTVKSTSSSVDTAAARAALTILSERGEFTPPSDQPALDVGPIETTPVSAGATVDEVTPAGDAAATVPVEPAPEPVIEPAPWAPLFAEAVVPAAPAPAASAPAAPAHAAPVTAATEVVTDTRFDDLPPRLRVHELAKRAGVSAKVMIAELADRGIPAKSANSVVAKTVAQDVLSALLAPTEPVQETEADTADTGTADTGTADAGTADDRQGRRRRGRRGRGRTDDRTDQSPEQDDSDQDAADESPVDTAPVASGADASARDDESADSDDSDESDSDDNTDDTTDNSSRPRGRRRRRRGGRGADRTADDNGPAAEGNDTGEPESGSESEPAETADTADTADTEEDDTEDGAGSNSSRRRRRRRRGGSDDSGRTDDPADTVVHVREVRSAESEVQGVRGSTRLEAKRQRRRDSLQTRRRPQILTEAEFLARREAVHRVMAVRQRGDLTQVAVLEDSVLVEHFVSRAGSASMIGNVYLGRVQNVLPSMEAAFVDIGRGRNAVLYAGEVNWEAAGLAGKSRKIETALSSGDTVLVQVSKDPVGHKGARLTTQISLPGRFLVYVPAGGATGISRKLPDTERKRLKAILDRIVPDDAGVIIRTAAEGVSEEELAADVERLKEQWEQISASAKKLSGSGATKQLYSEPDTLIKVIRDLFNSDISELIIDGDDDEQHGIWESLSGYVEQVAPELAPRVHRFTGATDVFAAYRIDEQIAKALERKVYLPSGGSLVIDRTEAMTVVDVNTGKYTGSGGNLEETVTKNNLEAAEEVVRQLRLRDIGGIIVVDFIDMVLESNRELVLRRLTECLGRDRTRHQVAEVTSLGLVQMTRKKMGTGLVEAFSEPCEHCHGRGIVLRDVPVDPGVVEAVEQTPDRSSNRRNRGRGREAQQPEVDLAQPPALPAVPPLRRDPRGPKPPEHGGARSEGFEGFEGADGADGTESAGSGVDSTVTGLSSELLAELNGLPAAPAPESATAATADVTELESLLPGGVDAGSEQSGPRRRRRGGRGKSRRDFPENGPENGPGTGTGNGSDDSGAAEFESADLDSEEILDVEGESALADEVATAMATAGDGETDGLVLDDPQTHDMETDEVESDDPAVELALDAADIDGADDHVPGGPVDSDGSQPAAALADQRPTEPVAAEVAAPEPAPAAPRRRRAGRPAGPPQVDQSASLL